MTFAFSAGAISFLNPCGFAMLPAYIAYFIESTVKRYSLPNITPSTTVSNNNSNMRMILARKISIGILIGIVITVVFVTIFGLTGLAISVAGTGITKYFPWIAVISGIVIIGMGIFNILGKTFHINIPLPKGFLSNNIDSGSDKDFENKDNKIKYLKFFLFGIGYSVASLSCTLPVFLLVVFQGISTGGLIDGFLVFLIYALGMGIVMIGVSLAISISNQVFIRLMIKLSSKINFITSAVLIGAGLYLLYYNVVIGKLLFA